MSRALIGRSAGVLSFFVAGCATPGPSSDQVDESIVITLRGADVDFGEFQTFFVRPEVFSFGDDEGFVPVDESDADALVSETERNMTARGYREAATPESADLGVQILYVDQVSTAYWCYSWYDPYYWGYPSYYYYPYYGDCDATVWRSGMLATVMVDLSAAREDPDPGGQGGAGGNEPVPQVAGVWFSGIYAVSPSVPKAREGIDQAFEQSPYISASQ